MSYASVRRDLVRGAAEFAAGADDAVGIGQAGAFFRRIALQHLAMRAGVAIAAEGDRLGRLHPHFVFVEQPPQHGLGRQLGVHQFQILHRLQEQRQPLPVVAVVCRPAPAWRLPASSAA